MADLDLITAGELDILRALARQGQPIIAAELARVGWPAPKGDTYYTHLPLDRIPAFAPIRARNLSIEARLTTGYFLELTLTDDLNDDTIPLEFADPQREVAAL